MPRLVLQLASLCRDTLVMYGRLLALPMDDTSSPDLMIKPFGSGIPIPVLQLVSLWKGTQIISRLLFTLPMGSTLYQHLPTRPFESGMPRLAMQLSNHSRRMRTM